MKPIHSMKRQTAVILLLAVSFSMLSICTPAVAGGYSGNAPLRIGVVSIKEWSGEPSSIMGIAQYPKENEDGEEATPSNAEKATKANANKTVNKNNHPPKATLSDAGKQEIYYTNHE